MVPGAGDGSAVADGRAVRVADSAGPRRLRLGGARAPLVEGKRELAGKIITHPFWEMLIGPDAARARSPLKHAHNAESAES